MPLKHRLTSHLSNRITPKLTKYIGALKAHGLKPVIEAIDTTTYERRRNTEEYWVQQISSWGFDLLNVRHNRVKNYTSRKERYQNKVRFTDDEINIIRTFHREGDWKILGELMGLTGERVRQTVSKKVTIYPERKKLIMDYFLERVRKVADWYIKNVAA